MYGKMRSLGKDVFEEQRASKGLSADSRKIYTGLSLDPESQIAWVLSDSEQKQMADLPSDEGSEDIYHYSNGLSAGNSGLG